MAQLKLDMIQAMAYKVGNFIVPDHKSLLDWHMSCSQIRDLDSVTITIYLFGLSTHRSGCNIPVKIVLKPANVSLLPV